METLIAEIESHINNELGDIDLGIALYEKCPNHNPSYLKKFKSKKLLHKLTDPNYTDFGRVLEQLKYEQSKKPIPRVAVKKKAPSKSYIEQTSNSSYPKSLLSKMEKKGWLANQIAMLNRKLTDFPMDNQESSISERKLIVQQIIQHGDELSKIISEQRYFEKYHRLYEELPEENDVKRLERLLNNAAANRRKWQNELENAKAALNPDAELISKCELKYNEFCTEHQAISTELAGKRAVIKAKKNEQRRKKA